MVCDLLNALRSHFEIRPKDRNHWSRVNVMDDLAYHAVGAKARGVIIRAAAENFAHKVAQFIVVRPDDFFDYMSECRRRLSQFVDHDARTETLFAFTEYSAEDSGYEETERLLCCF